MNRDSWADRWSPQQRRTRPRPGLTSSPQVSPEGEVEGGAEPRPRCSGQHHREAVPLTGKGHPTHVYRLTLLTPMQLPERGALRVS